MASGPLAAACRQLGRLYGPGTVAGLAEGQLLDRFVARRDDAAFEAIVARHGPMVRAVCRALLRDQNDVDDAFQATFLVLVKKAETLRRGDLLGNWLYGVAHRVARRARSEAARRRDRESAATRPSPTPRDEPDDRAAILAEIDRLPGSYRSAVVLCYLEGRTHEEAARELGWPIGTVKGRLARARDLLRDRLARRGLAPSAGALLLPIADDALAAVPAPLLESTVATAVALASGRLASTSVILSTRALALAQGVLPAMSTTTLKWAATLFVAAGVLSSTGVSAFQGRANGPSGRPDPAPPVANDPPKADPGPAPASAEARVKLAEGALQSIKALEERAILPAMSPEKLTWLRRLAEARADAGVPRAEAMKPYIDAAVEAAATAQTRFQSGRGSVIEVLEAQYRGLEASALLGAAKSSPTPAQAPSSSQGGLGAAASDVVRAAPPAVGPGGAASGGGGFGGGFGGGTASASGGRMMPQMAGGQRVVDPVAFARMRVAAEIDTEEKYPRPRKQPPSDVERNKAIEEKLERIVPMKFANETPLVEVLKYVRQATRDAKGKEIPIYVDPLGLQEAEKTIDSPVTLDLDDVPLRTTLRLILVQLGLDYDVRDGLLKIDAVNRIKEVADGERFWEAVERAGSNAIGFPAAPNEPSGQPAKSSSSGGGFR